MSEIFFKFIKNKFDISDLNKYFYFVVKNGFTIFAIFFTLNNYF